MGRARIEQASITAEARLRTGRKATGRALSYLPPWLMWLSLPFLALLFWLLSMPGKVAAMLVAAALAAGTIGLTAFTSHVYARREPSVQIHATAFVGGCGIWVLGATVFGLFVRPNVDVWPEMWRVFEWTVKAFHLPVWATWLVAGIGGCLTWSIRRVSVPAEGDKQPAESALDKVLAGARVIKQKAIDGRVVAEVEVNRGEQTVKDLQAARDHLAGALRVRPDAIRITPNSKDAGRAHMTIVPIDPLSGEVPWPGPSAPGASIADAPVPLGVYEDAEVAAIWLCGDDEQARALAHWLVMGMNGAGKSQGWVVAMADALTRCDFALWGSDHVKGKQTFGPLLPYMAKVAATLAEAKQLIAQARDEAARRQADFGGRGIKQWEKGCGYPLLVVWIEEASEIVDDSSSFVRLVERARSAGVVIVVSLQRASHDNINTSARAQLAGSLCFGVRDGQDATFALPDNVLDAGAAPDAWGNRQPGYCYLVAPGVPEERWHVPLRTFRGRDPQLVAALQAHHPDAIAAEPAPVDGAPVAETPLVGDVEDDEDEEMVGVPPDLDPHLPVDPDAVIAPPDAEANLSFGAPAGGPKLSTEQARAVVQRHLRTLLGQGKTHTQPADICTMKPETTRTREWVRQECIRLCQGVGPGEIGLERDLADVPGVFRILAPALTGGR